MIKVKLLHPNAKVPTRANETDAGLDLHAVDGFSLRGGCIETVPTGISISIPDGYVARILPRSGLAAKHGIHVMAGVVDSSYRGEIKVILANLGDCYCGFVSGSRIAQLVIQKVELWTPEVVNVLDETERGDKGFGSSGV